MKKLVRSFAGLVIRFAAKYACKTYGDVAELSHGPCQRCVGQQVIGVGGS